MEEPSLLQPQQKYHAALYVRVSTFNGGKKDSNTIENQLALLQQFIDSKPSVIKSSIYIDNGESGVDFNRSQFERLLCDIKAGKINCIVVKDLSRFGRNYIETGEYLEKIFPFSGVRFIAINDNYDSIQPNAADILRVHLKNLVNDIYARDISRKVCPVLMAMQRRGEFIGTWAPYGYQKSEANRHKLVIDQNTAPIVRGIFKWRSEGWTYRKITEELIAQKIPSPGQYRYECGIVRSQKFAKAVWKPPTIMRMLSNQQYIGHMVQGKKRSELWRNQRQTVVSQEEWMIVPNTHEPIIDKKTFDMVQKITGESIRRGEGGDGQRIYGDLISADFTGGW